jgi:hypothetical protein
MRLVGDEWKQFFDSYETSAFRLETLAIYRVDDEAAEFARFLAGETPPLELHYPWLDRVSNFIATGRIIQRVHVVRRPLTDYLRYEFDWAYKYNVAAGEDIRILDLTEKQNPGVPEEDFWMFDERRVVRMLYRSDGSQIGRELLDDPDIEEYLHWRTVALDQSVPFEDYWAR